MGWSIKTNLDKTSTCEEVQYEFLKSCPFCTLAWWFDHEQDLGPGTHLDLDSLFNGVNGR